MVSNKNPYYRNDFARIAVLDENKMRSELIRYRDKNPYFPLNHKYLLAEAPKLLNALQDHGDLFGGLTPEQLVEKIATKTWVNPHAENSEQLRNSVRTTAQSILKFSRDREVSGRNRRIRGFQVIPGVSVTNFWMEAVFRIGNQNSILFLNPRSTRFNELEKRFVLSLMREGVAEGLALARDEVQLGILDFRKTPKGTKEATLTTNHGLEHFSLDELQSMVGKMAEIWLEINSGYGEMKSTGTNEPRFL
ncbi:MAG: hypothetical protein ABJP66_07205 [Hyphomicrobiales bacterium]